MRAGRLGLCGREVAGLVLGDAVEHVVVNASFAIKSNVIAPDVLVISEEFGGCTAPTSP